MKPELRGSPRARIAVLFHAHERAQETLYDVKVA